MVYVTSERDPKRPKKRINIMSKMSNELLKILWINWHKTWMETGKKNARTRDGLSVVRSLGDTKHREETSGPSTIKSTDYR